MARKRRVDNKNSIFEKLEQKLSSYEEFEERIKSSLKDNYFCFAYQSLYNQIGYSKKNGKIFTTACYKDFVSTNHFVDFVNDIYNTYISTEGIRVVSERLKKVDNLDDYDIAISIFEHCNPTKDNRGNPIMANQFCLGTKLLHFYDPEQNPILDNIVKDNLGIKGENGDLLTKMLCIEFREAAKCFCEKHSDYFDKFYESDIIAQELRRRCMTKDFSTMGILDMALYIDEKD